MTADATQPVLRRMLKPAPSTVSGAAITEARAWRMSLPRVSEQAAGLVAAVSGLDMQETDLEGVLAGWDAFALTLALSAEDAARGLLMVDADLRAGLIEVQTLGQVLRQTPPDRRATKVDAELVGHVIDALIAGLEDASPGVPRCWRSGELIADVRAAKMAVDDGEYRVQDLTVLLGDGARTGRLRIVTPYGAPVAGEPADSGDRSTLYAVEAELHAVLHRSVVPYRWLAELRPGALLEIPAEALAAVRIEDGDGKLVARARLGKSRGQRALRLTDDGAGTLNGAGGGTAPEMMAGLPEPGGLTLPDALAGD